MPAYTWECLIPFHLFGSLCAWMLCCKSASAGAPACFSGHVVSSVCLLALCCFFFCYCYYFYFFLWQFYVRKICEASPKIQQKKIWKYPRRWWGAAPSRPVCLDRFVGKHVCYAAALVKVRPSQTLLFFHSLFSMPDVCVYLHTQAALLFHNLWWISSWSIV